MSLRGSVRLGIALLLAVQITLLGLLWANGVVAPDFFPIHFGAALVARGESPYGPAATALLVQSWRAPDPFPRAGIAYPLPLLLLALPLALLPFPLAAAIWNLAGVGLVGLVGRLGSGGIVLVLLFWPIFWNVALGQATLLWSGLIVVLLMGIRQRRAWLVGLCIALLPLKPQTGLLFALAGAWWAWRNQPVALAWAASLGGGLAGLAWIILPGWLGEWLGQLVVYSSLVRPTNMQLWGILLLAACWRLPWWSKLALVQVFLFPLVRQEYGVNSYALLPLLLTWLGVGGRLAMLGASLSWAWPLLVLASLGGLAAELTLFAPLALCGAWRWRQFLLGKEPVLQP